MGTELTTDEIRTLRDILAYHAAAMHRDTYHDIKERLTAYEITPQQAEKEADDCDVLTDSYEKLRAKLDEMRA